VCVCVRVCVFACVLCVCIYSVLQCVAVYCSVLQCVAVCGSVLQQVYTYQGLKGAFPQKSPILLSLSLLMHQLSLSLF